jgi:hypothetical protein
MILLTCWWDGIVSQLRAYSASEFKSLAEKIAAADYFWHSGRVPIGSSPGHLTYLIGSNKTCGSY